MRKIGKLEREVGSILKSQITEKGQIRGIEAKKNLQLNSLLKISLNKLNKSCKNNGITKNRLISYHEMVRILYSMNYIGNNITEYEKLLIDNLFQST